MLAHVFVGRNISIAPIALKNWDLVLWLSTKAAGWFIFVWVFCLVVFFFYCVMSWIPGKRALSNVFFRRIQDESARH